MKKFVLNLLLLFALGVTMANAQPARAREKIEAMKVGYITQKLNLTTEEAQRFWPVYNRYTDELEKQRNTFKGKMMEELSDIDGMSDAQADKALNEMIAFRLAEVDITKKYVAEFKKVLPMKKVVMLFKAEQEFKKDILIHLKEQRRERLGR